MKKSSLAIACLLAGGLMAPGAFAEGTVKSTQASPATTTHSADAKEAVSDAAITTKIKAQFATDKDVSATHIKVDTDNGVVKLSGMAASKQEADRAEAIAHATKGVSSVSNNIQVGSSNMAPGSKTGTTGSTKY